MIFIKIGIGILIVLLAFFVLTFIIYMFNLDMKFAAVAAPLLNKIYDKRKRDKRIQKKQFGNIVYVVKVIFKSNVMIKGKTEIIR